MSRTKTGTRGSNPLLSARLAASTGAALLVVLASGCSSRSLTIQSNPTGAEAYLDGEYVGITPVTVPFVYGGEREILIYRPKKEGETKSWRPKRVIYDTTNQRFDLAFVDLVADVSGAEDKQTVGVDLKESNLAEIWRSEAPSDPTKQGAGWRAAMRARADTLRRRAREFQLGALPTSAGRDPGPLGAETQPTTRAEPLPEPIAEPPNPEPR